MCGGTLVRRDDDDEVTVRRRLDIYRKETEPLEFYFWERGLLRHSEPKGHRHWRHGIRPIPW